MPLNSELVENKAHTLVTESDFELLFKRYFQRLCNYAQRIVPDLNEAKDIVQFAFSKLWDTRDTWNTIINVEAYLFKTVHNNCLDFIRHQKIKSNYRESTVNKNNEGDWAIDFNNNGLQSLQHAELQKAVRKAIDELPEQCQKIFILSRFSGKKYSEIATELNLSIKTVESQMTSAFKRLRLSLGEFLTLLLFVGLSNFF